MCAYIIRSTELSSSHIVVLERNFQIQRPYHYATPQSPRRDSLGTMSNNIEMHDVFFNLPKHLDHKLLHEGGVEEDEQNEDEDDGGGV